jgi:hypothetical protein
MRGRKSDAAAGFVLAQILDEADAIEQSRAWVGERLHKLGVRFREPDAHFNARPAVRADLRRRGIGGAILTSRSAGAQKHAASAQNFIF